MLELFAIAALISSLNIATGQVGVWTFETQVDENTMAVVEITECENDRDCGDDLVTSSFN